MSKIRISIIIPVYNTEKYLERCLKSVENQTLRELEVIVIDDGSTDNSILIEKKYENKFENFILIKQKNSGQSAARNRGIDIAKGKYIYFLDSDDSLKNNALEIMYNLIEKNKTEILMFDADTYCDGLDVMTKINCYDNLKRSNRYEYVMTGIDMLKKQSLHNEYSVAPYLLICSRNFLGRNKIRFLENIIFEDNLFTYDILYNSKSAIHYNLVLYNRYLRPNSTVTTTLSTNGIESCFVVMEELLAKFSSYSLDYKMKQITLVLINQFVRKIAENIIDFKSKRKIYKKKMREFIRRIFPLQLSFLQQLKLCIFYTIPELYGFIKKIAKLIKYKWLIIINKEDNKKGEAHE